MDIDGRICAGILGYPASAICVANRKLVRKVEERGQLNGITSFLLILLWSSSSRYDRVACAVGVVVFFLSSAPAFGGESGKRAGKPGRFIFEV